MTEVTNIFEQASRLKLRVSTPQGLLLVEQLWDLKPVALNAAAIEADAELSATTTKSFLPVEREDVAAKKLRIALELRIEILKHIIGVKLAEEAASKSDKERKAQRDRLTAALAAKQEGKLSEMTEEELQKAIAAL